MMKLSPAVPLLALVASVAFSPTAHATVYKCVDAQGRITYTNDRSVGRNCTPLDLDLPVSSIPPPSARPGGAAPPASAPAASFPRVSPDAQRARDDTRRQILEGELEAEQAALSEAQAALEALQEHDAGQDADGRSDASVDIEQRTQGLQPHRDKVELHERNIEALRRELRGLR